MPLTAPVELRSLSRARPLRCEYRRRTSLEIDGVHGPFLCLPDQRKPMTLGFCDRAAEVSLGSVDYWCASSDLVLIRLSQHNSICWDGVWLKGLERSVPPRIWWYAVGLRPVPRPSRVWNAAMGCLRRLWRKINLKLIAAHAVIGSDQPLLEIPNGAVCQRQHRVRAFAEIDSQGLRARHMLKSSFLQPREALETVGVDSGTQRHIFFQEG